MLYTLVVKPIALLALGGALWLAWRAGEGFEAGTRRRHRRAVGLAALAIGLVVLAPPAWEALRDRPGETAGWILGLALAGAAVWLYARLIGAARRRARQRHGDR